MKIHISIFLLFTSLVGYSQELNADQFAKLKQEILDSKEVADWQKAMIVFQKSDSELCILKEKLHSFEKSQLSSIHFSPSRNVTLEDLLLKFFRILRITDELKDNTILNEKVLRTKFPQLATHFEFDQIFPELYAPIQKAREAYLKIHFKEDR